jgi:putative flippase GtrA
MKPVTASVFFPIYNERENLPSLVETATRALTESPYVRDYEIILIDDGSRDGSGALADEYAARDRHIRAIHHPENRGYGEALKTGIRAAHMDYIFFTDADLQFDIVELNALLAHLPGPAAVIGYRAPRRDPFMRLVNAWGWNVLNRLLFGLKVRDIDCAFKLFKREVVQALPLQAGGAMASAEILIRLTRAGHEVKEVPVSHRPRRRGSPTGAKLSVIYRAFGEMAALYRGELGGGGGERAGEVIRFGAVGLVNTSVDALLYLLLTRGSLLFGEHLLAAKFFSYLAGTISSLFLNRTWTCGVKEKLTLAEVARFYAMTSFSLVTNVVLMHAFLSLGLYDVLALAAATAFTFLVNFVLSKFWVFKTARKGDKERYATS